MYDVQTYNMFYFLKNKPKKTLIILFILNSYSLNIMYQHSEVIKLTYITSFDLQTKGLVFHTLKPKLLDQH